MEQNIIFKIGSAVGPGGFASLKAAVDIVVSISGKIAELTKDMEQFAVMWRNTNQQAVIAADNAAKGLIDTSLVIKSYNQLMAGNVKITDEQYKILAVRATEMAQATGQDATEAFKRLTDSIKQGSTEALREYGIDLKASTSLTGTQNEAIDKLTRGFKDLTVEYQNNTERLHALNNNWGTFTGLLWDATGEITIVRTSLDNLNEALGTMVGWLQDAPQATTDWLLSLKSLKVGAAQIGKMLSHAFLDSFVPESNDNLLGNVINWLGLGFNKDETASFYENIIDDEIRKLEGFVAAEKKLGGRGTGGKKPRRPGAREPSDGGGGGAAEEKEMSFEELTGEYGNRDKELASEQAFFEEIFALKEQDQKIDEESFMARYQMREQERAQRMMELEDEEYRRLTTQEWREEDDIRALEDSLRREYLQEQSIDFASNWSDAWQSSFSNVSAGAMVANASMSLLHAGVSGAIKASIAGQKTFKEAIRSAVEEVGTAIAVEAGFLALMELGKGIAAAASYNYAGAAGHFAAAAQFAVVAVVAGGAAAIAHSVAPSTASAANTGAGPGSSYSGGGPTDYGNAPGYDQGKEVTVIIDVKPNWFEAVVDENDRASYGGRRYFTGAGQ